MSLTGSLALLFISHLL